MPAESAETSEIQQGGRRLAALRTRSRSQLSSRLRKSPRAENDPTTSANDERPEDPEDDEQHHPLSRASAGPKRQSGRSGIAVEVVIDAPVAFVWDDIEDITTHVDWMQDAAEIRFVTTRRRGVGARFECVTKVGPIRLTDVMEVTEWKRAQTMGVMHDGIVSGTGVFSLRPSGSSTVFSWVEKLSFPWYFAGPLGAWVARPVLKAIWKGNLRRLKTRIEAQYGAHRAEQRSQHAT